MILARSALRDAIVSGDLKIQDDHGNPFTGFKIRQLGSMMAPAPNSFHDLTAPGIVVSEGCELENPKALEPASIDLHVGNHWLVPKTNARVAPDGGCTQGYVYADSRKPVEYTESFSDEYMIPAHGFILARTQECVHISDRLTAWIEGRSSFGRFGFFVQNAGWTDPGFQGSITLEIYNALPYPALLVAGTPCCQLVVSEMIGDAEGGYQGSYQGQLGTKGSMLYKTVPGGVR